ncbi:MAG: hypothetical protein M1825_006283 [Sarcosagium campestre]|nr:MAG: hypothetical protein M1825_006283 [Sarcosagium campestre]
MDRQMVNRSDSTTSSLGDSTYEILGESAGWSTDEDEHDDTTDSFASTEGQGTDDASISGIDRVLDVPRPERHAIRAKPRQYDIDMPDLQSSDTDADDGSVYEDEGIMPTASITFEEPDSFRTEIAVTHVIGKIGAVQTSSILKPLGVSNPPAQLTVTIRQTMSKHCLAIDEPLRILYIGNPAAKDDIISKIGTSLVVSCLDTASQKPSVPRSQKFNVVPVSSISDRKASDVAVALIASDVELIVDDCTAARSSKMGEDPGTLSIQVNHERWYTARQQGSDFKVGPFSDWKIPHAAIFFSSEHDGIDHKMTRFYAEAFMARCAVPIITISREPLYAHPSSVLDTRSVHMCLEARGSGSQRHQIYKRLPIDLATFLSLDARQMNRNLAYLTGLHAVDNPQPPRSRLRETKKIPGGGAADLEKLSPNPLGLAQSVYKIRERKGQEWRALLLFGFILFCAFGGTTMTLAYQRFGQSTSQAHRERHAELRQLSGHTMSSPVNPLVVQSSTDLSPKTQSLATSRVQSSKSLAAVDPRLDLSRLLLDPSLAKLNDSNKFKMQIVGDCHVVLRSPHRFSLLKRPPTLFAIVAREQQVIESHLTKLFDGFYALRLGHENAFGPLNITIWTESKPVLEQKFQVDFGTPWLKVMGWRRAAGTLSQQLRRDILRATTSAQLKLRNLSADAHSGLQYVTKGAEISALKATTYAKRFQEVSRQLSARGATQVAVQTKQLSRVLATGGLQVIRQLWKFGDRLSIVAQRQSSGFFPQVSIGKIGQRFNRPSYLYKKASKTFTVARAQKQAKRVWQKTLAKYTNRIARKRLNAKKVVECKQRWTNFLRGR